ncbi:Protein kinase domain [Dillenia turbinata]|uniref:non-specific serine/threonine protein kinase n=1 Tax=Dillenia turbinata TaxID=194707 RepID=A0AAN8UGI4_9MAGN
MATDLNTELSKETFVGLKLWELICFIVGLFIALFFLVLFVCLASRKKSRRSTHMLPVSHTQAISEDIKDIRVDQVSARNCPPQDGVYLSLHDKFSDRESERVLVNSYIDRIKNVETNSQSVSFANLDKDGDNSHSGGEDGGSGPFTASRPSSHPINVTSPLSGMPEFSHLGWGHWFTLRDLEVATNRFSKDNVIGEGGYGVVYRGCLINGAFVAVKKILNNLGQAEKEFRTEVEAIGHVRHKNLVRLLGYCIEGTHRLSYLHEAIEPKVVHRDIKSSNILIDDDFNAKVSDFGLAKLLGSGKSHITTRVMGTFGYVAPEYANSGLLNEKSDIYSFGVLLLEAITGRAPVDFGRPTQEVNLIDWLKMMVGNWCSEEVVDPNMGTRPSTRALKRALLTALRCVDPDAEKRPKMSQVVRMLESEEYPLTQEDRRHQRNRRGRTDAESLRENYDTDKSDNPDGRSYRT